MAAAVRIPVIAPGAISVFTFGVGGGAGGVGVVMFVLLPFVAFLSVAFGGSVVEGVVAFGGASVAPGVVVDSLLFALPDGGAGSVVSPDPDAGSLVVAMTAVVDDDAVMGAGDDVPVQLAVDAVDVGFATDVVVGSGATEVVVTPTADVVTWAEPVVPTVAVSVKV